MVTPRLNIGAAGPRPVPARAALRAPPDPLTRAPERGPPPPLLVRRPAPLLLFSSPGARRPALMEAGPTYGGGDYGSFYNPPTSAACTGVRPALSRRRRAA